MKSSFFSNNDRIFEGKQYDHVQTVRSLNHQFNTTVQVKLKPCTIRAHRELELMAATSTVGSSSMLCLSCSVGQICHRPLCVCVCVSVFRSSRVNSKRGRLYFWHCHANPVPSRPLTTTRLNQRPMPSNIHFLWHAAWRHGHGPGMGTGRVWEWVWVRLRSQALADFVQCIYIHIPVPVPVPFLSQ